MFDRDGGIAEIATGGWRFSIEQITMGEESSLSRIE